jgi:trimethylamine:corrinoid methyltransferase-like protein
MIAALAGARVFRTGGLLSAGEVYSGEILVMAKEMIEYIKTVLKKEEFSSKTLMVDEIKAVEPGQSYIGRKSTLENFRKEYWEPELFIHNNLGQWTEMGSKSTWESANELVKRKISEHSYSIDADVKKELDKIYDKAKKDRQLEDSFKVVS